MLTSFDVGRTFRTPILKLGVSCIAAISKEKVIWTEGCIVAAGCSLALVAQLTPFGLHRQNGRKRREEHWHTLVCSAAQGKFDGNPNP
jgi:hypothetical protein